MTEAAAVPLERVRPHLDGARFAFVFGSLGTPAFGDESDLELAAGFGRRLEAREVLPADGEIASRSSMSGNISRHSARSRRLRNARQSGDS